MSERDTRRRETPTKIMAPVWSGSGSEDDFERYRVFIEDACTKSKCKSALEIDFAKEKDADKKEAESEARFLLFSTCHGTAFGMIRRLDSAYKMWAKLKSCLLYTSPSPRDGLLSRMPSSA